MWKLTTIFLLHIPFFLIWITYAPNILYAINFFHKCPINPKPPRRPLFFVWYYHWSNFLFHLHHSLWFLPLSYHECKLNVKKIIVSVILAMACLSDIVFPFKYSKSHLEQTSTNRKCSITTNSSRCSMCGEEDLYTWWDEFHRNCIRWRVFFRYRLVHICGTSGLPKL